MKKALSYPIDLLSKNGVVDLRDCSTRPASLHLVDESEVERIEERIEIASTSTECIKEESII